MHPGKNGKKHNMIFDKSLFKNLPILITGHTGFKGGWLSLWLNNLGAKVHGYALNPIDDEFSFFNAAQVKKVLSSDTRGDIRNLAHLKSTLVQYKPKLIFHMAAQPLVREGYIDPLNTFDVNIMGTAKVLEAARDVDSIEAIVVITTDKVYQNIESSIQYKETDRLGGHDPYSASKAASEIVTSSYRLSFLSVQNKRVSVATARAGNVIGGGDWAKDRLVPDCIKAFSSNFPIYLRNPNSLRPWQHVLEPLSGYIRLAEKLLSSTGLKFEEAWNFGPDLKDESTVGDVAKKIAKLYHKDLDMIINDISHSPHEANLLSLDSNLAKQKLDWSPIWSIDDAIRQTVNWHIAWKGKEDMLTFSLKQIEQYESEMNNR